MADSGRSTFEWDDDVRFVRALVRGLVSDDSRADDVAQEAVLASLRRPTAALRDRRAWLAAVARNLVRRSVRSDRRRRGREEWVARDETTTAADEAAARLDWIEYVVRAVRRLDDPYRSTIVHRYLDEWPIRRIAKQAGVSESTVRTRLSRGLARVREDLDRRESASKPDWRGVLFPFTAEGIGDPAVADCGGTGTGFGSIVLAMKAPATFGIVGVLSIFALVFLLMWQPEPSLDSRPFSITEDEADDSALGSHESSAPSARSAWIDESEDSEPTRPEVDERPFARASLFGRVVDARRFPVAEIDVVLEFPGAKPVHAMTDSFGRFRFERVSRRETRSREGSVRAVDHEGSRIGMGFARLSSRAMREAEPYGGFDLDTDRELDLGTLVLEPAFSIEVRVLADSDPVGDASLTVDAWPTRLRTASVKTDADGVAHVMVPQGDVWLEARIEERIGRTHGWVDEDAATSWIISLDSPRMIDVLAVDDRDGSPLVGVEVGLVERCRNPLPRRVGVPRPNEWRLVPIAIPPTDTEGRTRVTGIPPSAELLITAKKHGFAVPGEVGNAGVPETRWTREVDVTTNQVLISMAPAPSRTVRVPVVAETGPVPEEGSPIELRRLSGASYATGMDVPSTGRMEGGDLVIDGVPGNGWLAVVAEALDGRLAPVTIEKGSDTGVETWFRTPRSIEVTVREADASLVEGALLDIRDQGGRHVAAPIATDASGRARHDRLFGELVEVSVFSPDRKRRAFAGTYDLAASDVSIDVTLPAVVRVSINVTVDGAPGLPSTYRVHSLDLGRTIPVVEEDPDEGRIVLEVSRDEVSEPLDFTVSADGYYGARLQLDVAQEATKASASVDFRTMHRIFVRSVGAGDSERRVELSLERWSDRQGRFVRYASAKRATSAGGLRWCFGRPEDGVYRIRERWRGVATDPIDIRATIPGDFEVTFDLARSRPASDTVDAGKLPSDRKIGGTPIEGESAIQVRLRPSPGSVAPRVGIFVTPRDHSGPMRQMFSQGREDIITVRGLAAGSYEVVVNHQGRSRTLYSGTVVLDGERDTTIEIDL